MVGYQHMKFELSSATKSQYMNAGAKVAMRLVGKFIFHKNRHWLPDNIFDIRNA
jgi:hypothetical protein